MPVRRPQRLLLLKPSSLGDIVHGLQLAQMLRDGLPGSHLTWVAREVFAPLVRICPAVDEVLVFERHGGVRGFLRLLREIRARRFDAALDLQGLVRTGMMLGAARAPRKIAPGFRREGAGWFATERMPRPDPAHPRHAVDLLLDFLPGFGLPRQWQGPLRLRPATAVPSLLAGSGPAPVLLFPESRRPEKEWPAFPELAAALRRRWPAVPLVWMGSRRETSAAAPVLPAPGGATLDLRGHTRLEDLPGLLQAARLVVCNDSGPMHLAAALERPVVALFGPTAAARFGPYPPDSPRHRILSAPGGDLRRLTVDAVAEALAPWLDGDPAGP